MSLKIYKKKRLFSQTPEPRGKKEKSSGALRFVVQKHQASHLHYDFRLEMKGILKSWTIPKGPSVDPAEKRLAVEVEDHPVDYMNFEGTIPPGNYGAGEIIVWDIGHYHYLINESTNKEPPISEEEEKILNGIKKGNLQFSLWGQKLKGSFSLIKMEDKADVWLLIKIKDEYSTQEDITLKNQSVISQKAI